MKVYIKKVMSIVVTIAILCSIVSADYLHIGAEETSIEEITTSEEETGTSSQVETTLPELIGGETTGGETTVGEINETTAGETNETTSEETTVEEIVVYNENQQRVVDQIKTIPEKEQNEFMDKVKALYLDYLTLTEDEIKGISEKDNAQYKSILASAGEINHTDEDTGISVYAEELPWYVKIKAEKTDESAFKEKYESYIESLYEREWEYEYEDEEYEEDWEDEEYQDEEDEEYLEDEIDEEYLDEEEIDKYYAEAYEKYVEGYIEWAKEQNVKYNVEDYLIQFETDSFSEFAVCLNSSIYKTTDQAYSSVAPQVVPEKISPKTGTNITIPLIGVVCSTILIFICIPFYRKREDDIV